jgi:hypothetical protein
VYHQRAEGGRGLEARGFGDFKKKLPDRSDPVAKLGIETPMIEVGVMLDILSAPIRQAAAGSAGVPPAIDFICRQDAGAPSRGLSGRSGSG